MKKKQKTLRVKEPNLLIEAKQKMTREELLVWAWCLVNARFWITDGHGRELTLEELKEIRKKQEVFYAVSIVSLSELKKRFPDYFTKDRVKYWREVLKGMEKKIGFEVNYALYKQTLTELGFDYILEKFKQNRADKYFGIATIMAVGLSGDGQLTITYTPLVAPLLVLLKKWFTIYNFEEVLKLDLKASIVLYRLFKEKLGLKRDEFELSKEELLELLDLKKVSGKDLARKYVEPAIKEINGKTRLKVEVEQIRRGRGRGGKIVGFRFRVEEAPARLTTDAILENNSLLEDWLREILNQLIEQFKKEGEELTAAELAQALLSFKTIDPATVLWFLLHFVGSKLLSAWEILREVEGNTGIKFKERFLKSVLPTKKEEYDFLLDPRINPLLREALRKIAGFKEASKEEPAVEEDPLKAKIKRYWEQLPKEGKKALLNSFGAKDLKELLNKDPESVWGALKVIYRAYLP